jgi:hypothetical protein
MNTNALRGLTTQTSLLRQMSAIAMLGMRQGLEDEARAVMRPVGMATADYETLEAFLAFSAAIGGRPQLAKELLLLRESNAEQGYLDAVLALGLRCAGDQDWERVIQRLLSLVDDMPTREFVLKVSASLNAAA